MTFKVDSNDSLGLERQSGAHEMLKNKAQTFISIDVHMHLSEFVHLSRLTGPAVSAAGWVLGISEIWLCLRLGHAVGPIRRFP